MTRAGVSVGGDGGGGGGERDRTRRDRTGREGQVGLDTDQVVAAGGSSRSRQLEAGRGDRLWYFATGLNSEIEEVEEEWRRVGRVSRLLEQCQRPLIGIFRWDGIVWSG